ncbi:MAG TPA: aminotransferase class III-fold pyridoxal phosphate-dependent enzyme, partial [Limnochordia bacterium]|nr:aminotransferase class III-fold pyridoxal phosphate-dependent enzyme [Limnochordia bacterium]
PTRLKLANLMGLDGVEIEAEGCLVRDSRGKCYIDCLGGFGTFALGHRHPKVIEAVRKALDGVPISTRYLINRELAEFAARLAELTPGDLRYTFPIHAGASAVEGALKMARAATGRAKIVSMTDAFHGKSFGALSVSGKEFFKTKFRPLLPDTVQVPFGDIAAAKGVIDAETAAVIVEPIQGEAGVVVPPDGYLRALRALCDAAGALLIADEVQTGLGRTGYLFACEHDQVAPDLMTLAKALGGGVMPLGAFIGNERAFAPLIEDPYLHSATVESTLSFAAAQATLDVLVEEDLSGRAKAAGERLLAGIRAIRARRPRVIDEVRGRGLMIGVTCVHPGQTAAIIGGMLQREVLVGFTFNNVNVLRFEPPLIITDEQIDAVLARLDEAAEQAEVLAG